MVMNEDGKNSLKSHLFWFCGNPCKILPTLLLAISVTTLGSSMLYGYNWVIMSHVELPVKNFFRDQLCGKNYDNCSITVSEDKINILYDLLISCYAISGAMGCFLSAIISDKFGRRNSLIANNIIGILGGGCILITMWTRSIINLFVGRLILGFNAGITTGVAPVFLAEISPTIIRGSLIATHQLLGTVGIVISYMVTFSYALNAHDMWIGIFVIPMLPCALSFALLFCVPESPRYLLIMCNDNVAAIKSCFRYNHIDNTSDQLKEIRKESEIISDVQAFKYHHLITKRDFRIAILVALFTIIMQQCSGFNAVIDYHQQILRDIGLSKKASENGFFAIAIVNVVSTLVSMLMIESKGRRKMLIYPTVFCISFSLGLFLTIGVFPKYWQPSFPVLSLISLTFIYCFIIFYSVGMGTIPYVTIVEIFTQVPRAGAYSTSISVQWICTLIVFHCYPTINANLHQGYVFIASAGIMIVLLLFISILMPETKNRSLRDISSHLQQINKKLIKLTTLF